MPAKFKRHSLYLYKKTKSYIIAVVLVLKWEACILVQGITPLDMHPNNYVERTHWGPEVNDILLGV